MTDPETPRPPLTRDRILRAAVTLADEQGLGALTMRRLGAALDVEAMSLYKHVDDKDAILDGMVEIVIAAIDTPARTTPWKAAMRQRAVSARRVLTQHSWAIGLIESRGLAVTATTSYVDAIIGCLRAGGFSIPAAAHAFWLLDSFVYGHVLQEAGVAAQATGGASVPDHATPADEHAAPSPDDEPEAHPDLRALQAHAGAHHFDVDREFTTGLELVLDAVATLRDRDDAD